MPCSNSVPKESLAAHPDLDICERTITLLKSKPSLVMAVATVLVESSRITFRIAAAPFEISFSEEFTGRRGKGTSISGDV